MSDNVKTEETASLSIRGLGKYFGNLKVLDQINLDVEEGEFVALVGPSGCGKSTLLRMIAGLEEISEGEVQLNGQVINEVEPKDRDMAMVFQNYALYPHLSVSKNMGFSLSLRSIPKTEIEQKVQKAAQILGLEDVLDRRPSQLSGGQRQRVAMGRAIVRQPRVFLFDEPLSNLDAKLRVRMRGEIKQLHQRFGTTTIYVTHDQIEAMTMADKVVVMREGRIEQVGKPLEIYDWPNNIFVAQFIGSPSMNILSGMMTKSGFRLPSGEVLPTNHNTPDVKFIGIRPDKLKPAKRGLKIKIDNVETGGAETFLAGQVGDQDISVILSQRLDIQTGDTLVVTPELEYIHYFDDLGVRLEVNS